MSEEVIHPGNRTIIKSARCTMDALKYSRAGFSQDNLCEEDILISSKIVNGEMKLKKLNKIQLDSGHSLYISKDPPTWFMGTKKLKEKINKGLATLGMKELTFLYNKGLLEIDGKARELKVLEGRYAPRTENTALVSMTDRCNLNCGHCVANANHNNLLDKLNTKDLENILRTISEEPNPLGLQVEKKIFLSGGEPTLRKDLARISRISNSLGLSTYICTNGINIPAELLKELKGTKVAFIVSYDGTKEKHEYVRGRGTYEKTVRNIKRIANNYNDLFINNFLHKNNFQDMEHVVEFALDNNVKGVNFIRAIPRGKGKHMKFKRVPDKKLFDNTYKLMTKNSKNYNLLKNDNTFSILALSIISGVKSINCGLSRENYFFLDCEGNLYPCPGMRYPEFKVGNVLEQPIKGLLKKRNNLLLTKLNAGYFPICSNCDYTHFCGGDCRGSAYGNSNPKNIKAPVPYCTERQESLKTIFNILSLNPKFMIKESREIIENAREETKLYK